MRQSPIVLKPIKVVLTSTFVLGITLVTSLETSGNWFRFRFTSVVWFSKVNCLIKNIYGSVRIIRFLSGPKKWGGATTYYSVKISWILPENKKNGQKGWGFRNLSM